MTPITPLRQRLLDDLQLHGLAPKTQDAYVRAVRQLAEYYHRSPDQISEEELRQYLLHLQRDRQVAASTFTQSAERSVSWPLSLNSSRMPST